MTLRTALIAPLLLLGAGCSSAPEGPPPAPPEPARARAAIASLHVQNDSGRELRIFYRLTPADSREVGIGSVGARASAAMAPVPAGEPIILFARTTDGAELILAPRTIALQGHWRWVIPANARFILPPGGAK